MDQMVAGHAAEQPPLCSCAGGMQLQRDLHPLTAPVHPCSAALQVSLSKAIGQASMVCDDTTVIIEHGMILSCVMIDATIIGNSVIANDRITASLGRTQTGYWSRRKLGVGIRYEGTPDKKLPGAELSGLHTSAY